MVDEKSRRPFALIEPSASLFQCYPTIFTVNTPRFVAVLTNLTEITGAGARKKGNNDLGIIV
jgi:hypothetical protein